MEMTDRQSLTPQKKMMAKSKFHSKSIARLLSFFDSRGWKPFEFQMEAWLARLNGESGLIHVPTGAGKTFAAVLGALMHAEENKAKGLRILYVTPLKAVARDIGLAINDAIRGLELDYQVESRTGDTSAHRKAKQRLSMPEVLITTPESLELLLCDPEHERLFRALDTVIVDEWHECLSNKRGTLLELSLSRLRALKPELATWAMTATIENIEEAAQAVVGLNTKPHLVRAKIHRPVLIDSLIPEEVDAFPWAGQLGLRLLPQVLKHLDVDISTLIFTNTRSAAERWFQSLRDAKPEWAEKIALHHGSLSTEERERVEEGVKSGELSLVVCTSSLDLGVDFGPVERILQIGSPKGIGRLLQRAGRAAHRPGGVSSVLFVPTNSVELIEIAAVRRAVAHGEVEARHPLIAPLDVLIQHLVTRAIGGGFTREQIETELRSTFAYKDLTSHDLDWALQFVQTGGDTLQAYNAYRKVLEEVGVFRVRDPHVILLHKMNIGTIVSDASVELKFQAGKSIGRVDEGFIGKLKKGDRFLFSGRVLQFLGIRDLEARVKLSSGSVTVVPSFSGSRLPYSAVLSRSIRELLGDWRDGEISEVEASALRPLLRAQGVLPYEDQLLIETAKTRQGHHLFIFPFEGRPLHEGLAAILALRLGRLKKATFSISSNDYGIELLSGEEYPFLEMLEPSLFTPEHAREDLAEALDLTQLARQKFREIGRVAGLVNPGRPSARKNDRQLQASAGLLFDVLRRYEPGNPLVKQAENQVLHEQLEDGRLIKTLKRLSEGQLLLHETHRPSPFAFTLVAERLGARLSTESLAERLERLKNEWRVQ